LLLLKFDAEDAVLEVSHAQGMIHAKDALQDAMAYLVYAYLCYGLRLLQGIIHAQDALHEDLLLCLMPDLLLLYYSMLTYGVGYLCLLIA
jgi:hypothetical protein